MNAELALQLLFSPQTTVCHLGFLPALSANIAVCTLYCILTAWDIFNEVVSGSHSPNFGFELLQGLPFVFKQAAVEREVGKTQDHLSARSTKRGRCQLHAALNGAGHPGSAPAPGDSTALRSLRTPPSAARHI